MVSLYGNRAARAFFGWGIWLWAASGCATTSAAGGASPTAGGALGAPSIPAAATRRSRRGRPASQGLEREDGLVRAARRAGGRASAARRALERFRYGAAEARGTVFAWRRFLRAHPKGILADRARDHLARARYQGVAAHPSLPTVTRFLARHGDHALSGRAWRQYLALRAAQLRASGSREALRAFLHRHPKAPMRRDLARRLERLSYEALGAGGTSLAIQRFLSRYPLSGHRQVLRRRLRLRALGQATFWGDARALLAALGKARGDLGRRDRHRAALLALGRVILEVRGSGAPPPEVLARAGRALSMLPARSGGSAASGRGGSVLAWMRRLSKTPRRWRQLLRLSRAAAPYRITLREATLRAALHGTNTALAVYAVWLLARDDSRRALEALLDAVSSPSPILSAHAALAMLTWGARRGQGARRRRGGPVQGKRTVPGSTRWEQARAGLLRDQMDQVMRCRPCGLPDHLKALALAAALGDPKRARTVDGQPRWPRPWRATGALLRWAVAGPRAEKRAGGRYRAAQRIARPASALPPGRELVASVRAELARARGTLPRADLRDAERRPQALAAYGSLSLLGEAIAGIRALVAARSGADVLAYARLERECRGLAEVALRRAGGSSSRPRRTGLGRAAALREVEEHERQRRGAATRLAKLLTATRAPAALWEALCRVSIKLSGCD